MTTDLLSEMHNLSSNQVLQFQRLEKTQNDIKLQVECKLAELQENITSINKTTLADISNINTSLTHLIYYSQYREELIIKAENLRSPGNQLQSFPVIVKIPGISELVKHNNTSILGVI